MITHCCRLTTNFRTAVLLTLFLLMLTSISPAQQLTSAGVPAAFKDLKDKDAQDKNLSEALHLIQCAVTAWPANPIFLHSLGWAS